jgi:MoaA/NifB/PqqE/SkfB family radical SAM enzyme
VNTTVASHNLGELDALAQVLETLPGVVMWSVFFLVPTGRAAAEGMAGGPRRLTADEAEAAFETLWRLSHRQAYAIKTTEAPHYRRFLAQKATEQRRGHGIAANEPEPAVASAARHFVGTNDGKGVVFVGHTGQIFPSGFLPIPCGRFPFDSVVRVYQKAALFEALRDPDRLGGKCGACEFRNVCGGSRARAFAVSGDPLAEEPDCAYVPRGWSNGSGEGVETRAAGAGASWKGAAL